jgi:hypothetical protein
MRRQIPGLHSEHDDLFRSLDGLFLVRVESASYRYHPQKPFLSLRFGILEPSPLASRSFMGRIYCTQRALWKLNWFLRDFAYDPDLLSRDQVDERALLNLRGVVRTTIINSNLHPYQNLDAFAPASKWETVSQDARVQLEREACERDL